MLFYPHQAWLFKNCMQRLTAWKRLNLDVLGFKNDMKGFVKFAVLRGFVVVENMS